jgi:hypothetical protein
MIMRAATCLSTVSLVDASSTTSDVMVGTTHGADIGAM